MTIKPEPPKPEYTAQPGDPECDVFVRQPDGKYGYVIRLPYTPVDLVARWNTSQMPDDVEQWMAWKLATVYNVADGRADLRIMERGKAPWPLSAEAASLLLKQGPLTINPKL